MVSHRTCSTIESGCWPPSTMSAAISTPAVTWMRWTDSPSRQSAFSLSDLDGVTSDVLNDRIRMLAAFDNVRRDLDASRNMDAMDRFTQQAVSILTSGQFANALDLAR